MKAHHAVWLVLAAALLWLALRRFERSMIYFPSRGYDVHPGSAGLDWERLRLRASDGVELEAWWLPGPRPDAPVLLCLHGNGGSLSHRVEKMRLFRGAGAAQLWVDYRGYGASAGVPSEKGLYRDAEAAWSWLAARGVPASRVVVYGESLGGGVAVELATRRGPAGLIFESGFTSLADMAKLVLPRFPARLASERYDSLGKIAGWKGPLLVLHSPQDDIVPFELGRRVFEAAPGPKTFVELKGDHNEGFLATGPAYGKAVADFLARLKQAAP